MKWNYIISISLLFLLVLIIPNILFAADSVSVSSNVTITLPSDSTQYTLYAGGKFGSLTVNTNSFSFDLGDGSVVEITSADKKKLDNTINIATVCQADNSYVKLSLSAGSATTTVTVTPTGNACSGGSGSGGTISGGGSSGGGGGGGGSGTFSPTPTPVPTPVPAPVPTPTPPTLLRAVAPTLIELNRTLTVGSSGSDVDFLQEFLSKDLLIYPEGRVTGYFGSLTKSAVQKFQEKYGIAKKGDVGYGVVGPKTRAKVNELAGGIGGGTLPASVPVSSVSVEDIMKQIEAIQNQINKLKGQ